MAGGSTIMEIIRHAYKVLAEAVAVGLTDSQRVIDLLKWMKTLTEAKTGKPVIGEAEKPAGDNGRTASVTH
jgi:hypothetical protein